MSGNSPMELMELDPSDRDLLLHLGSQRIKMREERVNRTLEGFAKIMKKTMGG